SQYFIAKVSIPALCSFPTRRSSDLLEIVRESASLNPADPPELALEKLGTLVSGAPDVARRVASAVGLAEDEFSLDEIYWGARKRSEEHTSELQSRGHLVCRLMLEKK